jgi:RHS repeat-associated protein
MKRCRSELNRFNSGKIHPKPRDLSPASASSSAPARNQYTYYLHDGLGSVTALVDAAGNLDGSYDYGAFGDERRNTVALENRYRYTSREYVEPNLYYYRARYMRPDLGRFVSMDPLKMIDGTNMFGYVRNNPVEWRDPYGVKCSAADNPPDNPHPGGPGGTRQHWNHDLYNPSGPWWWWNNWTCSLVGCSLDIGGSSGLPCDPGAEGAPCACLWLCGFRWSHTHHHHHPDAGGETDTVPMVTFGTCRGFE